MLDDTIQFGATGHFPEGKLNADDEGGLQVGIAHDTEHVRIEFGKPVAWMAMKPKDVRTLAITLLTAIASTCESSGPMERRQPARVRSCTDMPIAKHLRHFYRGPAWQAAREECFARYGNKCAHCGLRNYTRGWRDRMGLFHPAAGPRWKIRAGSHRIITIQLGAAHINHTPGDDRPENLIALCRRDHLLFDKDWHRQTRATRKDAARPILAMLLDPARWGTVFEAMGFNE